MARVAGTFHVACPTILSLQGTTKSRAPLPAVNPPCAAHFFTRRPEQSLQKSVGIN